VVKNILISLTVVIITHCICIEKQNIIYLECINFFYYFFFNLCVCFWWWWWLDSQPCTSYIERHFSTWIQFFLFQLNIFKLKEKPLSLNQSNPLSWLACSKDWQCGKSPLCAGHLARFHLPKYHPRVVRDTEVEGGGTYRGKTGNNRAMVISGGEQCL
jgi:hypothetical protein